MNWFVDASRISGTEASTYIPDDGLSVEGEFYLLEYTVTINVTGNGTIEYSLNGGTSWAPFPAEGLVSEFGTEILIRSISDRYNDFRWDSISLDEGDYEVNGNVMAFVLGEDVVLDGTFYDNGWTLIEILVLFVIAALFVLIALFLMAKRYGK
jgi:hypothetical protein